MPDKKLTDAEIVKALEEISHYEIFKKLSSIPIVAEQALDLINRLQAEKEALINGQETLQKYIAEQKAKVEKLCETLDYRGTKITDLEAENERLVIAFDHQTSNTKYWLTRCDELVKENLTAKAEAYKEFAERFAEEWSFYFPGKTDLIYKIADEAVKKGG